MGLCSNCTEYQQAYLDQGLDIDSTYDIPSVAPYEGEDGTTVYWCATTDVTKTALEAYYESSQKQVVNTVAIILVTVLGLSVLLKWSIKKCAESLQKKNAQTLATMQAMNQEAWRSG